MRRLAFMLSLLGPVSTLHAQAWQQYASPEDAGVSAAVLDSVYSLADSVGSGALMVVKNGYVVAAYGDITRNFQAHSVRKSLLSGMYGTAVGPEGIDLDVTLEQLGIDDDSVLTAEEKNATLRQLISARSGIYLPAAYAGPRQDRPERGAFPPGTHWFYNNWDFNVAGVAYEQLTGESWYESFQGRIGASIGMEDFTPFDGFDVYDPLSSRHPAYALRISTRDLARFGQLYLQRGQWNGRQIIPVAWIDESLRMHSRFDDGSGYGYMWWIHPAGTLNPQEYPALATRDVYLARGTGGQVLNIVPDDDLVVVHRGDTDNGRGVPGTPIWRMLELVVRANVAEPAPRPVLVDVEPIGLTAQLPPLNSTYVEVPRGLVNELVGTYRDGPILTRVFLWRERPFITSPGGGSAELFSHPDGTLTLRAYPEVRFRVERGSAGEISGIRTLVNARESPRAESGSCRDLGGARFRFWRESAGLSCASASRGKLASPTPDGLNVDVAEPRRARRRSPFNCHARE